MRKPIAQSRTQTARGSANWGAAIRPDQTFRIVDQTRPELLETRCTEQDYPKGSRDYRYNRRA
jgi:hypothetical protein